MKQYNIYAGLGGSFGGATYQYTTLCETIDEALDEAYTCAYDDYESLEGTHGLSSYEDILEGYCAEYDLKKDDLSEEDYDNINDSYTEIVEDWLAYHATPTEEDTIDQEDLILGYVIEDDSSSQTSSK